MATKDNSYLDKHANPYLLFFCLCLLLYLPSAFMRLPFPPDEFRNLYIASGMHSWHDYLFPKFVDGFYFEKPPLYFWILNIFSYCKIISPLVLPTLFNTLIAWAIASMNFLFFKKEGSREIGLFSSLLLLTSGLFYGMSMIARMDILFVFFIYLTIYLFWFGIKEKKGLYLWLASFSMFMAVFTKGAFGILFPLLVMLSLGFFKKDLKATGAAVLVTIGALAAVLAWLYLFSRIQPEYIATLIGKQTIQRATAPMGHREPFYFYLLIFFPVMLPWSILAAGVFQGKFSARYLWEKVFISWLVGGLVILSCVKSKLPMYLLLVQIPFCALIGRFLWEGKDYLKRRLLMITGVFFLVIWVGAYVYCKLSKQFIPMQAIFVLAIFMACAFFMVNKPFRARFKNFFIYWCVFLQMLNFVFLPFASNASEYGKMFAVIKDPKYAVSGVYVREKELLTLRILRGSKPIYYLENMGDACKLSSGLIISKDKDFPCPPGQLEQVPHKGKYSIFYKK